MCANCIGVRCNNEQKAIQHFSHLYMCWQVKIQEQKPLYSVHNNMCENSNAIGFLLLYFIKKKKSNIQNRGKFLKYSYHYTTVWLIVVVLVLFQNYYNLFWSHTVAANDA